MQPRRPTLYRRFENWLLTLVMRRLNVSRAVAAAIVAGPPVLCCVVAAQLSPPASKTNPTPVSGAVAVADVPSVTVTPVLTATRGRVDALPGQVPTKAGIIEQLLGPRVATSTQEPPATAMHIAALTVDARRAPSRTAFVLTVVAGLSATPTLRPATPTPPIEQPAQTVAPAPADVPIAEVTPVFGTGKQPTVDPAWWPCAKGQIKANINSGLYHSPRQSTYARTFKNVHCYDTAQEAEQDGFTAAQSR